MKVSMKFFRSSRTTSAVKQAYLPHRHVTKHGHSDARLLQCLPSQSTITSSSTPADKSPSNRSSLEESVPMTPTKGFTPSPTPPLPDEDDDNPIRPFSVQASTSKNGIDSDGLNRESHDYKSQSSTMDDDLDEEGGETRAMLPQWQRADIEDLDDDDDDAAFDQNFFGDADDGDDEEIITTPRITDPRSKRPPWANEDDWQEPSENNTSHTRRKNRRVYGGGRHGDAIKSGRLGPGEVAGMILASTLSPTPLLMPHAAALLGLGLFLPVLFLTAGLSWFAYVVTGVEARYVGSRSWPSLTSSVFPHRAKLNRVGEFLASLAVFLGASLRAILSVVMMSDIVVDLAFPAAKGNLWWERIIVVCVMGVVWTVVPLVVIPLVRKQMQASPNRAHPAIRALLQLPAYIALLLWPLALLVLGVRLRQLNRENGTTPGFGPEARGITFPLPKPPGSGKSGAAGEAMGYSIWGGIALIVYSLTCQHDTFLFLTSLARPSSTAARRPSTQTAETTARSTSGPVEGRRNQWPLACAFGVGGATLVQLGWALVGYLGVDNGGREGNVLRSSALPRGDPWLAVVRWLVVLAIAAQVEDSLAGAYSRSGKIVEAIVGKRKASSDQVGLASPMTARGRRKSGRNAFIALGPDEEEDDDDESGARSGGLFGGTRPTSWPRAFARIGVWIIVVFSGTMVCSWGDQGEGAVSVAEIAGVTTSVVGSFLAPGLFFIALFHLRRPRSIFVSDPSAPSFTADTLLVRKEQQVQRKLSGRRIWQDVMVFGGLLPYATVVIVRGAIALIQKDT